MPTLNQTIEIFDQFFFKHKAFGKNQSRSNFFFGDNWEVGASGGLQYPLGWVSKLPTTYDKSGMTIHKFQVDISDKVNNDESNETNVLSDTEQYCFHLIDYIEKVADLNDFIINIGSVSEITDYTEKRDDKVSGNYFTIEIRSHNLNNSCVLPVFDGTIFRDEYIYIGGDIAGGFVVEIKDQSGNVLQTFNTSGVYTVEVLQQILDTITANTATIIDPIV
jgi:hypothetical protein